MLTKEGAAPIEKEYGLQTLHEQQHTLNEKQHEVKNEMLAWLRDEHYLKDPKLQELAVLIENTNNPLAVSWVVEQFMKAMNLREGTVHDLARRQLAKLVGFVTTNATLERARKRLEALAENKDELPSHFKVTPRDTQRLIYLILGEEEAKKYNALMRKDPSEKTPEDEQELDKLLTRIGL